MISSRLSTHGRPPGLRQPPPPTAATTPHGLKLRAMLQYKGLRLLPGAFVDSLADIAHALDRLVPFPALMHGSPRAQALCHAIEQWADTSLQPLVLQMQPPAFAPQPECLRALDRHLQHADALLADASFVMGERPCAADFALFGPLAFLLAGRHGHERVRARPRLMQFVERMDALERRAEDIHHLIREAELAA
jgi:glutathione S-transferase